ncbi:hypothetical protein CPB83DRAFT_863588 [Crepidotus variabilis]|uniref:F-box domain-containing protein n=1 Tax=Crepidotus variabilis TaxID=179855 RepID=A0A9P6E5N3_9AGAR|nr:hypothetical protein CPB83DRAFT_863588 [Crepidotus variabilis]
MDQPCNACKAHSEVKTRILVAEAQLAALKEEERSLRSRMNEAHDPMHTLPSEIASHIFEGIRTTTWYPSIQPFLALGSICQYWKNIAWATPSLWNELDFLLNPSEHPPNHSFQSRTELFQECINRSGVLPLRIYIYSSEETYSYPPWSQIRPLVDIITQPHLINRLTDSVLRLPTSCFLQLEGLVAPMLQKLILQTPFSNERIGFEMDLRSFTNDLEELAVIAMDLDRINISCKKLIHLEIEQCSPSSCIGTLRRAEALQSCTLKMLNTRLPDIGDVDIPTVQTQLTNMTIFYDGPSGTGSFLDLFSFPSLDSLRFVSSQLINFPQVSSFLSRSHCPLTKLYLPSCPRGRSYWPLADLDTLLVLVPTLSTLHVSDIIDSPSVADTFRTVFASGSTTPAVTNPSDSQRAVITDFRYAATWNAVDSFNRWAFISEVFSSTPTQLPKTIRLSLEIPAEEKDGIWVPAEAIEIVRELQLQGWEFVLQGHYRGRLIKSLVEVSVAHHQDEQ